MANSRKGFVVKAAAVQDALGTLIAAQLLSSSETTPLSIGYPAGGLRGEHIWISGEFDAATPHYISGGLQRDEEGEVQVRVIVVYSSADMAAARDRALALAKIVENAVSTDPTLAGAVANSYVTGIRGAEAVPDEHSRQYGLALRVAYQATSVLA